MNLWEHEAAVSNFARRKQIIEDRRQGISSKIINFDKISRDDSQTGLGSRQPHRFDNEIPRIQLGVKNQVISNIATQCEGHNMTILGLAA